MRLRFFASIAALCAAPYLAAQAQPVTQNYPVTQGSSYKFEKIADGVYYATGTVPGLGSNNVVVVNDTDVLIVDTGTSPAAARASSKISRSSPTSRYDTSSTRIGITITLPATRSSGRKCRSSRPIFCTKCLPRSTCFIASRT